ncbi:MAG: cyclopropane fatty acyl phospholipid synthase [Nitrospiraceae bacterium]|nr:cyclopropane fatty acyl phospholipid synthase [Nitrospiraceae bacterium]
MKNVIQEILYPSGIVLNGENPWDILVKDERFYRRVVRNGSLGLGESYMDGWWECECLDEFFSKVLPTQPEARIRKNWRLLLRLMGNQIINPGRKSKAFQIGERHYDRGNELFKNMLDGRMVYSCAYWNEAGNLDDAQEAKLDLICRKLGLKAGDRILDIGCGWGSLARHAAENYKAKTTGITVSKEQASLGRKLCAGLPVEIRLQDYRDIDEKFDHIVSVGMFEHVGYKNYRTYMQKVHDCLKEDGLFLLHTIGKDVSGVSCDPWTAAYIFPNSMIPSMKQISTAIEGLFAVEGVQNLGPHYDATLISWFNNFDRNWDKLKGLYDQRFYRMWKYYLLSSAGSFRSRCLHVWQILLSKKGSLHAPAFPGRFEQPGSLAHPGWRGTTLS